MNVFCIFMSFSEVKFALWGNEDCLFFLSFFPVLEIVMSYYWFEICMLLGDEGLGKSRCQLQAAPKG